MEKSVGLLVYRDASGGRVYLLLHYPAGHWDFPKGHVEEGENEQQTALRELHEETAITGVEIVDGFRNHVRYSFRRGDRMVPKEVVYFIARTAAAAVKLSSEHKGYIWLPARAAMERLTFANSRNVLKAAEEMLEKEKDGEKKGDGVMG